MYRCDGERTFVILKEEERKTKRKSCCALLKRKIQFLSYYLFLFLKSISPSTTVMLGSVAGPIIQANCRLRFENDWRPACFTVFHSEPALMKAQGFLQNKKLWIF